METDSKVYHNAGILINMQTVDQSEMPKKSSSPPIQVYETSLELCVIRLILGFK